MYVHLVFQVHIFFRLLVFPERDIGKHTQKNTFCTHIKGQMYVEIENNR